MSGFIRQPELSIFNAAYPEFKRLKTEIIGGFRGMAVSLRLYCAVSTTKQCRPEIFAAYGVLNLELLKTLDSVNGKTMNLITVTATEIHSSYSPYLPHSRASIMQLSKFSLSPSTRLIIWQMQSATTGYLIDKCDIIKQMTINSLKVGLNVDTTMLNFQANICVDNNDKDKDKDDTVACPAGWQPMKATIALPGGYLY
ncbi:unnamed protein product [Ilex paraguariensis]|uniref:Uncharacterized protein n=1 Tax=Ilex paraguariensis TaxID=185542 RepID=A0ABC8UN59_9AQUA